MAVTATSTSTTAVLPFHQQFHQYRMGDTVYCFKSKAKEGHYFLALKIFQGNLLKPSQKYSFQFSNREELQDLFKKPSTMEWLQKYFSAVQVKLPQVPPILEDLIKPLKGCIHARDKILVLERLSQEKLDVANAHLQLAETFFAKGDTKPALESYGLAFKYTRQWQDYEKIIPFYEKSGRFEDSQTARLCLALYQIEANAFSEAASTLEAFFKLTQNFLEAKEIRPTLAQLYSRLDRHQEAIELVYLMAQELELEHIDRLEEKVKLKKIHDLYFYIVSHRPEDLGATFKVGDLAEKLVTRSIKIHVLLSGACRLIERGEIKKAEVLCQHALEGPGCQWIDQLVYFEVLDRSPNGERIIPLRLSMFLENKRAGPLKMTEKTTFKIYRFFAERSGLGAMHRANFCPLFAAFSSLKGKTEKEKVASWCLAQVKALATNTPEKAEQFIWESKSFSSTLAAQLRESLGKTGL